MTRKEVTVFKAVEKKLAEARKIIMKHEHGTADGTYSESLDHADTLVLLAQCDVGHQLFLKITEGD
jgi:hypothetical protein